MLTSQINKSRGSHERISRRWCRNPDGEGVATVGNRVCQESPSRLPSHTQIVAYHCRKLLPILGLCLLLYASPVLAPPACTHYAAPNGSGSTCSESAPCNVGTWLSSQAAPGKVLCMKDGLYKGDSQMLQFPREKRHVRQPDYCPDAENDGKVEVNGEHQRRPLDCNASHIVVQGVNVRDGNDTTLTVRGHTCIIQRVVAWSTPPSDGGIENVVDVGGTNNLLEDLGAFGYARKTLAVGARGGQDRTVRRAWVEHNGSPYGSAEGNPTDPVDLGYNQDT